VRRLLRRCLERDVKRRLQAIGDARVEIEEISSGAPSTADAAVRSTTPPVMARTQSLTAWSVAGILALALAFVAWRHTIEPAPIRRPMQLTVPSRTETPALFQAISPDARLVVLRYPEGLVVRSIESGETRVLTGTQGGRAPFWSPDSRS